METDSTGQVAPTGGYLEIYMKSSVFLEVRVHFEVCANGFGNNYWFVVHF